MERLISSPWFAGGLAIALAVYSKRQDVKGEHIALLVAGLFGAIAVFQAVPESLPFALRGLWTTLGGSIIGLVLYYVFWTPAVSSVPVPSQQIQSAGPSEVEKQERRQLRNQIGELIQRGRIFQANLLKIGQRQIPNPRPVVASLVRDSMQWHLQVVQLAEVNFGHAEAMKVSIPPVVSEYPKGLNGLQSFRDGKRGGYDLSQIWANVVGDLAALDRFLAERPEL